MTIEVACSCGRVLKALDSAVGKKMQVIQPDDRDIQSGAQFCLALIGVLIQVQQATSEDRPFSTALGTIVLISLAWMLGIIQVSCPILLAVDAAKNLRAMRYEVKL
ncbi:hypothetical protein [Singulisphaera acidiphila]|uniref:Uncharacterized protein n=1 Tax=Singulisphaera acidiphila (strain ATCC BAA-1392 / DSM 18658 / VKM B-2454 / MOB10) TaxID=886293 RepID=L0DL47_SINAD|nr:hypothetical protein [Singulisphaera acidiphila]AGA29962.1 hypothetical protein Sinac_5841 [Singulisphaera acidiphila DSM 18658]